MKVVCLALGTLFTFVGFGYALMAVSTDDTAFHDMYVIYGLISMAGAAIIASIVVFIAQRPQKRSS